MTKNRLEAFSDAVIAIILTIMVLEMKVPHGTSLAELRPLGPVFLSYVLSFLYLGIYWNNHHHLLHAAQRVDGHVLWANLHLLFWLSLLPFVTGWMGENGLASAPVALYGLVLLCSALAYVVLTRTLIARQGAHSPLARSIGNDIKGWTSIGLYLTAIPIALVAPLASCLIYAAVAALWFVPDRRIEKNLPAGD
jgi:uncharacterized membrane protein